MCGIVGAVSQRNIVPTLIEGLKRLEYRGYDSCGVAVHQDGGLRRARSTSRVAELQQQAAVDGVASGTGIAHTRWATHGAPTAANAHPHATETLALVHNGIIENFKPLREALIARGRKFESETDTEVVAHLLSEAVEGGASPEAAVKAVLPQLRGAFALAIAFREYPDMLIGARLGSPLVVGYGDGETYLGSDALALAPLTQKIAYLDEGDWVVVTRDGARIFDQNNNPVTREITTSGVSAAGRLGSAASRLAICASISPSRPAASSRPRPCHPSAWPGCARSTGRGPCPRASGRVGGPGAGGGQSACRPGAGAQPAAGFRRSGGRARWRRTSRSPGC